MRKIGTEKNNHEKKPRVPPGFPYNGSGQILISQYENKHFAHHWHSELEFTVIDKGEMDYQANDRIYHLREGDAVFVNSNVLHSAWITGDGDCIYRPVNMGLTLLRDFEGSDIDVKYIIPVFGAADFASAYLDRDNERHKKIINLLRDCMALKNSKATCYELLIKAKTLEIWAAVCEEAKLSRCGKPPRLLPEDKINDIKAALSFMRENYNEHISVEDITRSCKMSNSEFCRYFKTLTHETPIKYLMRYRIQKSLPLIVQKGSSVTEIAAECGFTGPSYYAEIFRRFIGCSPLDYKKSHMTDTDRVNEVK